MPETGSPPARPAGGTPPGVAVTGLGVLAPNASGRAAFQEALRLGRSGVGPIQSFDPGDLPVGIAGEVKGFAAESLFGPREARHIPRTTALALGAALEALEDAGLRTEELSREERRRFGVVVGTGGACLEFAERQFRQYYLQDPRGVSLYTVPSSTPGSVSSEISMRAGLLGPSHVLSTGCTSSTDALGHALMMLRSGRADRVLAGGADAPLSPGIFKGFCLLKVLTASWNHQPERASRPFSADRDGFVLAEGSWMMVLERTDLARERGAAIYAELAGYGSTCEAFHRVRLDDSGEEPARAMALALEDAGVGPGDVEYVAAHGTSTALNDRIESRALARVFGRRLETLPVSSVKSMIGHPQGASGAAGVVATLLGMEGGFLPPTLNVDAPDPECPPDVVAHGARPARFAVALCNCIGFGSKNSAVVLIRRES